VSLKGNEVSLAPPYALYKSLLLKQSLTVPQDRARN